MGTYQTTDHFVFQETFAESLTVDEFGPVVFLAYVAAGALAWWASIFVVAAKQKTPRQMAEARKHFRPKRGYQGGFGITRVGKGSRRWGRMLVVGI